MTRRPVTMADVAEHAGVSRSAVSFALNDAPQISEATRTLIRASAAALGYRRNASARALAAQPTDLFGLVTDIVTTPFAGELISGAQEALWARGKVMIITATSTPEAPDRRAIDMMLEHRVGGIIFATTTHRAISIPAELRSSSRVALVHCFDPAGRLPSVLPDEVGGGRQAAELLVAAGRERIGMINLSRDLPAAVGRRQGFETVLRDAGLPLHPEWIVEPGADSADGYEAALALLRTHRLDGLFCANDRLAMGAYEAARELGRTIPGDLSIVGFDNQELIAAYLRPALTTISLPFREMGRRGAELVMGDPDGSTDGALVSCPPVIRGSI